MNKNFTINVINTKGADDRKAYSENLLNSMGIPYKIHEFERHKDPLIGCNNSHASLARLALQNDMDYIFIMEDNTELSPRFYKDGKPDTDKILKHMGDMAKFCQLEGVDVVNSGGFLTHFAYLQRSKYNNNLFLTPSVIGASFYVIPKSTCMKIVEDHDNGLYTDPPDVYFANVYRQHIYLPYLFHHRIHRSIVNGHIEGIRNIVFSKDYYRVVENMALSSDLTLFWIICSFLVLLLIVFLLFMGLLIYHMIMNLYLKHY